MINHSSQPFSGGWFSHFLPRAPGGGGKFEKFCGTSARIVDLGFDATVWAFLVFFFGGAGNVKLVAKPRRVSPPLFSEEKLIKFHANFTSRRMAKPGSFLLFCGVLVCSEPTKKLERKFCVDFGRKKKQML